ncbi:hypothetical protein NIES4101_32820 [Calothrix sp. NIES-4101]|nr:hypothetical protein NIES4101_32820 [Calothrix sp. NIES-4101]
MSDSLIPSSISQSQGESIQVSTPAKMESKTFLKNWKTTAIGLTLSFTGFVAFSPSTFGGEQAAIVQVCKYIASGGLAALGLCSKDFNITGGNEQK